MENDKSKFKMDYKTIFLAYRQWINVLAQILLVAI